MSQVTIQTHQDPIKEFAQLIAPEIIKYYSDPENVKAFKAWKKERDSREKS